MITVATFRISNGITTIDFLEKGSGYSIDDPYWIPKLAQDKGGGIRANPVLIPGQRYIHGEADNVVETVPINIYGRDKEHAFERFNRLYNLIREGKGYGKNVDDRSKVWIEYRIQSESRNIPTVYCELITGSLPELGNIFGQPFFSENRKAVLNNLTLSLERLPGWSPVKPGELIGPLYNLLVNPNFKYWTNGLNDSEPDTWENLETGLITGTNSRSETGKYGPYSLKIDVTNSAGAGHVKGVTQIVSDIEPGETYTIVAYVRSEGVTNGVGRILVTYSSQKEIYNSEIRHGLNRYVKKITVGQSDTVALHCQILTTGSSCDGTIYVDGLMFLRGDWEEEVKNNLVPVIGSSHIYNHSDVIGIGKHAVCPNPDTEHINHIDVWGVPGDEDSYVRVELQNKMNPSDLEEPLEVINRVLIGCRRIGNIENFVSIHKPPGVTESGNTSNQRILLDAITTEWSDALSHQISENVSDNLGFFRVFARIIDLKDNSNPTLLARLKYSIGSAGIFEKTLPFGRAYVRNLWTLLDVTRKGSANMDLKGGIDPISELDYTLQVSRETGSENAKVDYIIRMPTDGGFIDATISPPLDKNSKIIIDNTQEIYDVSATFRSGSLQNIYRLPEIPLISVIYKNSLYIMQENGRIHNFYATTRSEFSNLTTAEDLYAASLYNGFLHYSRDTDVYYTNGTIHSSLLYSLSANCRSMLAFDGYLYTGDAGGDIYKWDTSSNVLDYSTSQTVVCNLMVYNNELFAGTENDAQVYKYNNISQTWGLVYNFPNVASEKVTSMDVFKDKLYVGTDAGNLVSYDGDTWEVKTIALSDIQALKVYAGALYVGGTSSALYSSTDGSTYQVIQNQESFTQVNDMHVFNGVLHIFDNDRDVWTLSNANIKYKVTDFSGSLFLSPPKKHHRYYFLFDRNNRENNPDDQALVGIGFYPQFIGPGYVS